jgi:hypothetical protein
MVLIKTWSFSSRFGHIVLITAFSLIELITFGPCKIQMRAYPIPTSCNAILGNSESDPCSAGNSKIINAEAGFSLSHLIDQDLEFSPPY